MDIELLYFAGCPNSQLMRDRLDEALAATGHAGLRIRLRAVETDQDAQELNFPGSPTVRIDGRDPFPSSAQTAGLTCRVYPTPEGLAGSPTAEQLVQVIKDLD